MLLMWTVGIELVLQCIAVYCNTIGIAVVLVWESVLQYTSFLHFRFRFVTVSRMYLTSNRKYLFVLRFWLSYLACVDGVFEVSTIPVSNVP